MTNEYFKTFSEKLSAMTNTNMAPLVELHKLNTSTIERAAKYHMDSVNNTINSYTDHIKTLSGIKKAEDLTNFCRDVSKENSEKAVSFSRETMERLLETSNEYTKWLEKGLESVKTATTVK